MSGSASNGRIVTRFHELYHKIINAMVIYKCIIKIFNFSEHERPPREAPFKEVGVAWVIIEELLKLPLLMVQTDPASHKLPVLIQAPTIRHNNNNLPVVGRSIFLNLKNLNFWIGMNVEEKNWKKNVYLMISKLWYSLLI